jgi:hypothetical protein
MARGFENSDDHRDFLLEIVSRKSDDDKLLISAIRVLISLFSTDIVVFEFFLFLYAKVLEDRLRAEIAHALVGSTHFLTKWKHLMTEPPVMPSSARRIGLAHLASKAGISILVMEPIGNTAIDYMEAITSRKIRGMARRSLIAEHAISGDQSWRPGQFYEPKESAVSQRSAMVIGALALLQERGCLCDLMAMSTKPPKCTGKRQRS